MSEVGQDRLFDAERTFGVGELAGRLARAVAAAFPAEVWVRGEVHGLRAPNAAGHTYLSLCEKVSRRGPTTTLGVALFRQDRLRVERELTSWPQFRLADGLEVRVRGRVQYAYGRVQLVMSAIDPVHTLGQLAVARERVLASLAAGGLVAANGRLALPVVPLHVGLVASAGSAACEDVLHELTASGFGFHVILADARVQGGGAETSLLAALAAVARSRPDVVLLVRGGGSRTDLATFDDERLARAIAGMPVPVLTGIGHEIDTSVADAVAHTSLKTPTACARSLCDRVGAALGRAEAAWAGVARGAAGGPTAAQERLAGRSRELATRAGAVLGRGTARVESSRQRLDPSRLDLRLSRCRADLAQAGGRLQRGAAHVVGAAEGAVAVLDARALAFDPARALARGWTLTRRPDGRLVRRAADLEPGATLVTTFAEGQATSTVDAVSP